MKKVIGVITARMASTRLPGKVLRKLAGISVFTHHVQRMKNVKGLDGIFLVTSNDSKNKKLIEEAESLDCGWYMGAEQDIVDRHVRLCERENADAFVRVTCDNPIFDIESASRYVEIFKQEYYDYLYVSNLSMIYGTLTELVSFNAIREVHKHYRGAAITQYIKENLDKFRIKDIEIHQDLCRSEYRLTMDEDSDLALLEHIYNALYRGNPLELREVYVWLDDNPQIAKINSHVRVKGCNQHGANLMDKSLYSIVLSGRKHLILDEHKRVMDPKKFFYNFLKLFPQLKTVEKEYEHVE